MPGLVRLIPQALKRHGGKRQDPEIMHGAERSGARRSPRKRRLLSVFALTLRAAGAGDVADTVPREGRAPNSRPKDTCYRRRLYRLTPPLGSEGDRNMENG
jgi:hypothetical protein